MRQDHGRSLPIIPPRPTSIPLAVAIFLIGLLGFWLLGLIVPALIDDVANSPQGRACQVADPSQRPPIAAIPACVVLTLQDFGAFAADTLSHPDADELAVAHGGTTGEWLSALAQATVNMLVLAAMIIGLTGLWATVAVRLSRRLWRPRRPDDTAKPDRDRNVR